MAFDDVGDETDGLMAEGSIGDKQSQIDGGSLQLESYRRCQFIFHLVMPPDAAHKRNVNRRQSSHDLLFNQSSQSSHGKNDFRILPWHRSNARVVIDHNLAWFGIGWNEPVS